MGPTGEAVEVDDDVYTAWHEMREGRGCAIQALSLLTHDELHQLLEQGLATIHVWHPHENHPDRRAN